MEDLMDLLELYANLFHDGHYTLMKFTTNWGCTFGTVNCRTEVDHMSKGRTMEEAIKNAIRSDNNVYQINRVPFE